MRIPIPPIGKRKWGCLNDQELASYVDGKLAPAARGKAEAHLVQCLGCRDSVAILVRSERAALTEVPPTWMARVRHLGAPAEPFRVSRWAWAGAMACLLVAALVAAFAYRPQARVTVASGAALSAPVVGAPTPVQETQDQVRNLPSRSATPVVIAPADGARVPRDLEVRWQTLPTAVSYEVRLLDAAGDTVWTTQTDADHLLIPAHVSLQRGRKYFVLISASLPTGKTIRAKAVSFEIEANRDHR